MSQRDPKNQNELKFISNKIIFLFIINPSQWRDISIHVWKHIWFYGCNDRVDYDNKRSPSKIYVVD